MSSLFEDLKEGLEEAISFEKEKTLVKRHERKESI